jgi:hypothetical protein
MNSAPHSRRNTEESMTDQEMVELMLQKAREQGIEEEVKLSYDGYRAAGDPPRVAARFTMIDFDL